MKWDFPAKKHKRLSGQKVFRKGISFVNNLTIKHCDKTKVKTITV